MSGDQQLCPAKPLNISLHFASSLENSGVACQTYSMCHKICKQLCCWGLKLKFLLVCSEIFHLYPAYYNFTNPYKKNNWGSLIITPASTKLKGGYTGITLFVCPSVDRIVPVLYLQQYSLDPFHICTNYQATSEGVSRVMTVSKFKHLKFWRIF